MSNIAENSSCIEHNKKKFLELEIEKSLKEFKKITIEFLFLSDKNEDKIEVKEKHLRYAMLMEGISVETVDIVINRLRGLA